MKCLNCGCATKHYLCKDCTRVEVLDPLFRRILYYNSDMCEFPYLNEYASTLSDGEKLHAIIPDILEQFEDRDSEYYYCWYYRAIKDSRFEKAALSYLHSHDLSNKQTQDTLYNLINSYLRKDFAKPQEWCDLIYETDYLCCELYKIAADFFAMIGEYDKADTLIKRCRNICGSTDNQNFLFYSVENMLWALKKSEDMIEKYRTKKPYWPATVEARRALSEIYDKKGIKYPRIEKKPVKTPESDFEPIREYTDDDLSDYCAFWCNDIFSTSSSRDIIQIGAVKVRDSKIIDEFESYIHPWSSSAGAKKTAAKQLGVSLEIINSAEDVDIVMGRFLNFTGEDVLVSTDALGKQKQLITRAARYSGMKSIVNKFYDLLDLAADISEEFDFDNNNRDYLLSHFSIDEGVTAVEKARNNKKLYDALKMLGD